MFKIAIILAISAICFAADALPASTVSAVKAYDAEVAKAKAEYDRKDDAAKKVLVAALTKAQAVEMKANNLEGALAIKKKIEELMPKADDLLGDESTLVGKWKKTMGGTIYIINSDKTGKNGSDDFTWILEKNTIILSYVNHKDWNESIELKSNNEAMSSVGGGRQLIRIKE